MTNINPNNDIGKINHNIKKENKVNKKEKPVAETKQVEASSLDALNSYGKANVTFKGMFKRKKKEEVVTKKQIVQRLNEVDIPDEIKESIFGLFKRITKEQVVQRLNKVDIPDYVKKDIRNNIDTPERILLANKFLLEPKLYENESIQNGIWGIIHSTDNEEAFDVKMQIIDKYLSDPKLYENENLQQNIGDIIYNTRSEEVANARINIIDKYLSDPKWNENENIQQNIGAIISCTDTEERFKIVDKFLSNPKLYENENLQQNIGDIIYKTDGEERFKIVDKFLSNPKLHENENLQQNIGDIIYSTLSEKGANAKIQIIDKILSEPKLYENKNVQNWLSNIIFSTDKEENANLKMKIIDKYLSNPDLYENKNVSRCIGEIIAESRNEYSLQLVNKFWVEPKLYENENIHQNIGHIISSTSDESTLNARIQIVDKYLSAPKLYENENLQKKIGSIILGTYDKEYLNAKLQIIDKYLSNPDLYENKNVSRCVGKIIAESRNEYSLQLVNKFWVEPKLYKNENIQQKIGAIISCTDTEERFKIADKFLSNPKLYENGNLQQNIGSIIWGTYDKEYLNAKLQIIDKYLSNPDLYENKNVSRCIGEIIAESRNEYSLQLVNKFWVEPKLYENENIQQNIAGIIAHTQSEVDAEAKIQIIDKIFSEPMLYENENLQQNIGDIIYNTRSEEVANAKIQIIDKIFSEPMLYENENLQQNIGDIIYNTWSEEVANAKIQIIDKIFSEPMLYENENLQQKIGDIIYNTWSEEEANAKIQIIDKILSEPKLYENKNVQNWLSNIIFSTDKEDTLDIKTKVTDELLNNPVLSNNKEIQNNLGVFIATIHSNEKYEYAQKLFNEIINNEMSGQRAVALIQTYGVIDPKKIRKLEKTVPVEVFKEITQNTNDLIISANLADLYNKNNINEIPLVQKRDVLREIVKQNINLFETSDVIKQNFPLIPKNAEEYCTLLPSLVKSLGIETNEISTEQEQNFDNATKVLSRSLSELSDEEFTNLSITQKYSKEDFIKDVLKETEGLNKFELQKVFDYFGFELKQTDKTPTGYTIFGYPVNLNNGKKLAQIEDENTKQVVEQLRPYVIKFSENNKISCENEEVEAALNEIASVLPEIRTFIGKTQHETQHFDIMKHSLKVMQKVVQNPKFNELNDSDKKIMLLASLLHDSAKSEGNIDPIHAKESSFDAFYISQKFNLTKDERIKLYSLIDNHEWLTDINKTQDYRKLEQLKSKAFDLQYDNLFELSKIFTEADLKAVKNNDGFFERYKLDFENISKEIDSLISSLKTSQPLLPVTPLPAASRIKEAITVVNDDYSTNLKGVYVDENGMVIIKYNEVENETWEIIGFPKGSTSKGTEHTVKAFDHMDNTTNQPVFKDVDVDTGNIHFFVHGLDYENQLSNFDAFALPDSDALLSVSYAERPESKYRFFRSQGVILNTDAKYVHGGGETDMGSGCGKNIDEFKTNYAYKGSIRHTDRTFVSDLIKEDLGLSTQEYLELINKYKNKPFSDIEPKELQEKIIKALSKIISHVREGNRSYNEMYISNPDVMGYFAYDWDDKVGEIKDFINDNEKVLPFIKQNAVEKDMPLIVFGD